MRKKKTFNAGTGTMVTDVKLLGTSLTLEKGQRVQLLRPTNLPASHSRQWFARPADGKWSDGIDHNPEDSILIYPGDVFLIALHNNQPQKGQENARSNQK